VRPADARLSRGQWHRVVPRVSVCELAELALKLNLVTCEVVSKPCFIPGFAFELRTWDSLIG